MYRILIPAILVCFSIPLSANSDNWRLQGNFCSYSGSSSSYSGTSYSSTSKIYFDGQGQWSMSSESSFSGTVGAYYNNQGSDESGRYVVNGNQIFYQTNTGEQGIAYVHNKSGDGRITEIKVDGTLYAPALCY